MIPQDATLTIRRRLENVDGNESAAECAHSAT
jgi:hypothetical protein